VDAHLVLHGGTGVPVEDMQRAIRGGINKVNIGTGVHYAYTNGVRDEMERLGRDKYIWEIVYKGVADAREVVRQGIRMCMAEGKAKPRYQSLG